MTVKKWAERALGGLMESEAGEWVHEADYDALAARLAHAEACLAEKHLRLAEAEALLTELNQRPRHFEGGVYWLRTYTGDYERIARIVAPDSTSVEGKK